MTHCKLLKLPVSLICEYSYFGTTWPNFEASLAELEYLHELCRKICPLGVQNETGIAAAYSDVALPYIWVMLFVCWDEMFTTIWHCWSLLTPCKISKLRRQGKEKIAKRNTTSGNGNVRLCLHGHLRSLRAGTEYSDCRVQQSDPHLFLDTWRTRQKQWIFSCIMRWTSQFGYYSAKKLWNHAHLGVSFWNIYRSRGSVS